MLYDFNQLKPTLNISGIDISEYAIQNAEPSIQSYLQVGNAKELPYPDSFFDLVISINTIHNLELEACKSALTEIQRVSKRDAFITVDAWRNEDEKQRMLQWNLTALTYMHVDDWIVLFRDVGYTGDYYWFIAE